MHAAFPCALSLASPAGIRENHLVVFEDASEEESGAAVASESQLTDRRRDV